MPQRPGLRDPYVGEERLLVQEPPQAAPGQYRQRPAGQRPLQLPTHHVQLAPTCRTGSQAVE
ncbi:hypothetical protein [Streptomyces sp. NPDC056921]|uniref:hypothetical protein n=1 Tax=Streptomyces sp. NPDC056921 TaxID=3345966 RepID=UPI003624B582